MSFSSTYLDLLNVVADIAGGPAGTGGGGNMPMPPHPQFGYPAAQMPFVGGGPPFMPPGPPLSQPSGGPAHHVAPGSGCVVLVSNLDPEVSQSAGF